MINCYSLTFCLSIRHSRLQIFSPSTSVKLHMKEDSQASKALMAPLLRMENQWTRPGGTKDSSIMTSIWEPGTFSCASLPVLQATFWLHS